MNTRDAPGEAWVIFNNNYTCFQDLNVIMDKKKREGIMDSNWKRRGSVFCQSVAYT